MTEQTKNSIRNTIREELIAFSNNKISIKDIKATSKPGNKITDPTLLVVGTPFYVNNKEIGIFKRLGTASKGECAIFKIEDDEYPIYFKGFQVLEVIEK